MLRTYCIASIYHLFPLRQKWRTDVTGRREGRLDLPLQRDPYTKSRLHDCKKSSSCMNTLLWENERVRNRRPSFSNLS